LRLARVTQPVIEAAERLRKLDNGRTVNNQNELHVAFSGGLGAKARNQVVADLEIVIEAVLGRPPTLSELAGALNGDDAA
jgi:hypothetical protein